MRRLFSSTVAQLVAAIFILQLLSSAAAITFLWTQMSGVVRADRTRQVQDVRDDLLAAYYDGGREELAEFVAQRRGSTADPVVFVAVIGGGPPVLSSIVKVPANLAIDRPQMVEVIRTAGATPSEAIALAAALPDGGQLVVGASTASEHAFDLAFEEAIGLTLAVTVGLAIVSAVALGLVISRRTHAIAETAEALAAGDFAARIPHEDVGDGFDHLRRQVNLMAERIDQLVSQLRSVAGALAHDLQSPVARLRASIDVASSHVTDAEALEALQSVRTDAEALQAMLADALELGRLESGAIGDRRQLIDLGAVVSDMAELYEPLAEQSGIALDCAAAPVVALADRELLSRALANLIDNALKYGGSRISLSVRAVPGWAEISVSDDGPGIADAERARAVERFTRLDNARTRPGAGLGLAMVSAVMHLHGGTLHLAGGNGLTATLRLPRG